MKLTVMVPFLIICAMATTVGAQTAPYVYDVTTFGSIPSQPVGNNTCTNDYDTVAIQAAITAAHGANGGIVYFPPGNYCVSKELLGYRNVSLRGASAGSFDGASASVLSTSPTFGPNMSVVRVADRTIPNYGFEVENLSIVITSPESGIVGVDFSGVSYGAIRAVAVDGEQEVATGSDSNQSPTRYLTSTGTIGFLFSDLNVSSQMDTSPGSECRGNLIERTSASGVETAYRFRSDRGYETLNTVTNFWTADVVTGIWTSSGGSVGLSFRDGYLYSGLSTPGSKAFKHTAGVPTIEITNLQAEFFLSPSDLHLGGGIQSLGGLGLYVDGAVWSSQIIPILSAADGYNCGSTAACPCQPHTYPPPPSISFWASIPAGTALTAGGNTFTYYTFFAVEQPLLADLYFTFHPTHIANIGQAFQVTGTNSLTSFYGADFQTYTVTLFVTNDITLTSDFIFFLEANTTSQSPVAASCFYPPSL